LAAERDQREFPRIQGVFRVRYSTVDRLIIAYSHDLSKGGVFLTTSHFLPINAVIKLQIELPENGGQIPITCRVAYLRDKATAEATRKPQGMGIQFLDLQEDGLLRLQRFVAERSILLGGEEKPEVLSERRLNLVIADDDRASREKAAAAFRDRGDIVRTASDGLHALAECLKQPPDGVISDVQMPGLDGWQLVRVLRSRASLSSIPIVFLTSLGGEDERLRGYKLGIDDFIGKPFRVEELLARVDRAVARAQRPGPTLSQQKALRGDLEQVSLASVLSFLELEKKTGVLLLVGRASARIYVAQGQPLRVEIDGAPPSLDQRQLMDQILDWTEGQFEFGAQDVACSDDLKASLTTILLDNARRRDEEQK
jgi:uncharacterized protein (TIGR02266 family)